jgi:hypothetical protein
MQNPRFEDVLVVDGSAAASVPVLSPPVTPETITRPVPTERTPRKRQKRITLPTWLSQFIEQVITTIALLAVVGIIAFAWYLGAFFTIQFFDRLTFLASLGLNVAALGIWRWCIPVAITAIEVAFWPRRQRAWRHVAFVGTLLFDVGTTCTGLILLGLAGATIPLFGGFELPTAREPLIVVGIVFGLIFALGPEKGLRWVWAEFCQTWKIGVKVGSAA